MEHFPFSLNFTVFSFIFRGSNKHYYFLRIVDEFYEELDEFSLDYFSITELLFFSLLSSSFTKFAVLLLFRILPSILLLLLILANDLIPQFYIVLSVFNRLLISKMTVLGMETSLCFSIGRLLSQHLLTTICMDLRDNASMRQTTERTIPPRMIN